MARVRPKIVFLTPPGGETEELRDILADHCEVVYADSLQQQDSDASYLLIPVDHERDILLNSVGEALCLVTAGGKLLWGNRMFDVIDQELKEQVITAAHEAAVSFQDLHFAPSAEPPIIRREIEFGAHKLYELRMTPMIVDGSTNYGDRAVGVLRDISHAGLVRRKIKAVEQAGARLNRFDRDAVAKLNPVQRLRWFEERVTKASKEVLEYDHFTIRLLDDHTGRLEPVISVGFTKEGIELELYPAEEGNGTMGYVAATGKPYVCHDTMTDDRYLIGASEARSSLTVPLQIDEKIIGVLDIESKEVDAFDDQDVQYVLLFSRYVAMALQTLNMLVIEQSSTGATITGRFEGELRAPLEHILREAEELGLTAKDPQTAAHLARIREDVESIRSRLKNVAAGPNTLLGVDEVKCDKLDEILNTKRALIADDNERIGSMIADVLGRRGCEVVLCRSGQDAINELEASAADGNRPFDFVISDISMPDRNGYEVFSVACRIVPEEAIILMTGFGYDPHHSIVRASQEGMRNVLYKPFQASRLIDEVHKALTPPESA